VKEKPVGFRMNRFGESCGLPPLVAKLVIVVPFTVLQVPQIAS